MAENTKLDVLTKRAELLQRQMELKQAELRTLLEEGKQYGKDIEERLTREADDIAEKYAANFPEEEVPSTLAKIRPLLRDEARRLAFFYKNQYNQGLKHLAGKWAMFSRNVAMGTLTMGDIWHQLWANTWNLIFGPWVIGGFFVFLQFLLISNYVPPSAAKSFLIIMAPIIGGAGVFMLNFMTSKNPMDWLTHIISGIIIAYAAGMFWVAIFGNITNFPGGVIWFWITWFLSGVFIGAFQLYQLGGFRAVMQIAVLILLFSYAALGPYQAAYRQFIDRIKEPFTLAFRAVITAFNDAWVLATNPTEWYARQQLRNVRTEKPLELPKGIEITKLESLTPSVGIPADEEFEVFAVIRNDGRMDAESVTARIECNEFCDLPDDIDAQISRQSGKPLKQDDQLQLRFPGIKALKPDKSAFQIAKVTLYVSYNYSTNSTLPVKIASNKEIERALAAREDVFKPVTSIAMDGPAQLSLNVGPQPLKTDDSTSLLVAILNARPDGKVVLKKDMKLFVDIPDSLGTLTDLEPATDRDCKSRHVDCRRGSQHTVECTVNPQGDVEKLEIKATDFSTILPIFCGFTTVQESQVGVFKSDRIKAEFSSYIFETKKALDVTITEPLGVRKAPTPAATPTATPTATPGGTQAT